VALFFVKNFTAKHAKFLYQLGFVKTQSSQSWFNTKLCELCAFIKSSKHKIFACFAVKLNPAKST